MRPGRAPADAAPPAVQAVFCIDVRSEVYRRALEARSPAVQTMGFAGFFAIFIAYRPLGSEMVRPQLPGLLAPGLCVTDECDSPSLGQVLSEQSAQTQAALAPAVASRSRAVRARPSPSSRPAGCSTSASC